MLTRMTEPAEELQDPKTVARPEPVKAGWLQDDSQSPFEFRRENRTPPDAQAIKHQPSSHHVTETI